MAALERVDQHKARFLKQVCAEEGFCLYLPKLESTTERDVEAQSELKKGLDLRGSRVLGSSFAEKEEIIHDDVFEDRDANDNDYEEESESDYDYCSGTWNSKPRHYIDWVFVFIPEKEQRLFFTTNANEAEFQSWVTSLYNELNTGT
ncbi:hypothetical protein OEA41_008923 [Lepraria neglecta]|uniref:Uncharacterized protein n=1 Tax=Lepraria neglecta TaxID=209136 RepID=A0AAE0DHB6_9LECA|nr:hypothetical protein OEA41_008923 [Lepraria neglecta]